MEPVAPAPLSPGAAGLGCGVLVLASVVSLAWLGQAAVRPAVEATLGADLGPLAWLGVCAALGAVCGGVIGVLSARALRHLPSPSSPGR